VKKQPEYITIPKKEFENLKREVAELKEFIDESEDRHAKTIEENIEFKKIIKDLN